MRGVTPGLSQDYWILPLILIMFLWAHSSKFFLQLLHRILHAIYSNSKLQLTLAVSTLALSQYFVNFFTQMFEKHEAGEWTVWPNVALAAYLTVYRDMKSVSLVKTQDFHQLWFIGKLKDTNLCGQSKANQRPVSRSRDHSGPIRGQNLCGQRKSYSRRFHNHPSYPVILGPNVKHCIFICDIVTLTIDSDWSLTWQGCRHSCWAPPPQPSRGGRAGGWGLTWCGTSCRQVTRHPGCLCCDLWAIVNCEEKVKELFNVHIRVAQCSGGVAD